MKRILFFALITLFFNTLNTAEIMSQEKNSDTTIVNKSDIGKIIDIAEDSMFVAIVKTKLGNIEIQLFTKDAPLTTANFIELSNRGYYDGIIFHRVAKDFVIQGGDPTGTGSGGRSIYGREFEDELNPDALSFQEGYVRGAVAMANRGPNTNSSQFFITLNDVFQLPKNYTIFGRVINGMDTVDKIAAAEIIPMMHPSDGRPVEPVVMDSVVIEKRKRGDINSIFDLK